MFLKHWHAHNDSQKPILSCCLVTHSLLWTFLLARETFVVRNTFKDICGNIKDLFTCLEGFSRIVIYGLLLNECHFFDTIHGKNRCQFANGFFNHRWRILGQMLMRNNYFLHCGHLKIRFCVFIDASFWEFENVQNFWF